MEFTNQLDSWMWHGEAGSRSGLDGDDDGIICQPYLGRREGSLRPKTHEGRYSASDPCVDILYLSVASKNAEKLGHDWDLTVIGFYQHPLVQTVTARGCA